MDYGQMNQVYQAEGYGQETLGRYVAKTYLWMFAGLMLTFAIAVTGGHSVCFCDTLWTDSNIGTGTAHRILDVCQSQ